MLSRPKASGLSTAHRADQNLHSMCNYEICVAYKQTCSAVITSCSKNDVAAHNRMVRNA